MSRIVRTLLLLLLLPTLLVWAVFGLRTAITGEVPKPVPCVAPEAGLPADITHLDAG